MSVIVAVQSEQRTNVTNKEGVIGELKKFWQSVMDDGS